MAVGAGPVITIRPDPTGPTRKDCNAIDTPFTTSAMKAAHQTSALLPPTACTMMTGNRMIGLVMSSTDCNPELMMRIRTGPFLWLKSWEQRRTQGRAAHGSHYTFKPSLLQVVPIKLPERTPPPAPVLPGAAQLTVSWPGEPGMVAGAGVGVMASASTPMGFHPGCGLV